MDLKGFTICCILETNIKYKDTQKLKVKDKKLP